MVGCLVWFGECHFELMDLSISDLLQSILFVMLVSTFGHLWEVGVYSGWVLSLLHILQKSAIFFNVFFCLFWCFWFLVQQDISSSFCTAFAQPWNHPFLQAALSSFSVKWYLKTIVWMLEGLIALAYCFLAFFHQTKLEYIFLNFILFFNFTILYWFCHISK